MPAPLKTRSPGAEAKQKVDRLTGQFEEARAKAKAAEKTAAEAKDRFKAARKEYKRLRKAAKELRALAKSVKRELKQAVLAAVKPKATVRRKPKPGAVAKSSAGKKSSAASRKNPVHFPESLEGRPALEPTAVQPAGSPAPTAAQESTDL